MTTRHPSPQSAQQGVVLLEAMIAILIFSFAVLGIVGLQAAMVKNTSESKYRADAALIAQKRIAQIWADPSNIATYTNEVGVPISDLPNGTRTTSQAGTQVTVTVTWQQPGESQHNATAIANITGG